MKHKGGAPLARPCSVGQFAPRSQDILKVSWGLGRGHSLGGGLSLGFNSNSQLHLPSPAPPLPGPEADKEVWFLTHKELGQHHQHAVNGHPAIPG